MPDNVTDANGFTTTWSYDGFGRKTKETRPDGTSTQWAWSLCTSYCGWSNSAYQVAQTAYQVNGTTAIRTDTTSYDPVDRVTQVAGPTVTGTTATTQKLYNSLGLLVQQSMPFLSGTPYLQTFDFDVLNRPILAQRPISSTNSTLQSTSYAYAGRKTTITDPKGNTKTLITDVNGKLRKTTDALAYTVTRAYDAASTLTGVTDSVGNTLLSNVTVAYGIKPFVTAATDADRGAWTYTIDSLGERTGWTDAKGQSFSMTYDAQSRPLSRTEPDLFTEWNYGLTTPSIGKLVSECTQTASVTNLCSSGSWLYNEAETFDTLGRPWKRFITQNGNVGNDSGGFLYTLTYSGTTGLPTQLIYPTSTSSVALTLQYGSNYGLLQTVTDTSDGTGICGATCVLWTANAMNAFGQVTQETLGNGVITSRTFDAVTSWLTSATAGVGGGASLLNQSYLQDENGNVIQRQDGVHSLTESFNYDADNRLTCAALSATCSGSTFVYDGGSAGPGNITTQTGVGTYSYPAAGQPRPHAVTSITGTFNGITNPAFSYDLNGNMIDRASTGQNITWFSSNYPETVSATDTTGAEEVQFQYGPDRQRWKQLYTAPGATETTYYVGNGNAPAAAQLEVVISGGVTTYRYYINAGSEPIAAYSRSTSSTNVMNYVLEDHQGGASVLALNTGSPTTATYDSFTSFGQLRDSLTWSGNPTGTELAALSSVTRQGYTFQTWLGQSMGLNHMNGRVEDAILGRMISPDPHITDPTNAQNYNRYSYVNNNPLTQVDPTGFENKFRISDGSSDSEDTSFTSFTTTTYYLSSAPSADVPVSLPDNSDGDDGSDDLASSEETATKPPGLTAQSGVCGPCAPGPSSTGSTATTYWGDGTSTAGDLTLYVNGTQANSNGSGTASAAFTAAGMGAAGVELGYGESFLGTPNGGLYTRAWANGSGRAVSIGLLTKTTGGFLFAAGLAFDAQALIDGDITQSQFDIGVVLGLPGLASPVAGIAVTPYIILNSAYYGGIPAFYSNWTAVSPNTSPTNPTGSAYVSFYTMEP